MRGPWATRAPGPQDAVKSYTAAYALGSRLQSVGVDEGYNIWLLDGDAIGVLRPGDTQPTWTSGVGQAARGFGTGRELAMGSTVICGGAAGRAYVGYAHDAPGVRLPGKQRTYIAGARRGVLRPGALGGVPEGRPGRGALEADGQRRARGAPVAQRGRPPAARRPSASATPTTSTTTRTAPCSPARG